MSTIITVTEKKDPAPGKKQGAVYDREGRRWQVWQNKFSDFVIGQSYNIIETKPFSLNGTTYVTIEKFEPIGGAQTQPQMAMPQAATPTAPQQFRPPVQAAQAAPSSAIVPPSERDRQLHIFVCGAFNNIMSNPTVNPLVINQADMIAIVNMLETTWRNTLGRPPKRADMSDEIPL